MDSFVLPSALAAQIIDDARRAAPNEACGLIAGRVGVALALYPGKNMSATPRVAFELDLATLARQLEFAAGGMMLAAIYHSHPAGPEWPSAIDIELAYYPEAATIICSLAQDGEPVLRSFRISAGRTQEMDLIITDRSDRMCP